MNPKTFIDCSWQLIKLICLVRSWLYLGLFKGRRLILALVVIIPIIFIVATLEWSKINVTRNNFRCDELAMTLEKDLLSYNLSVENYNYHIRELNLEHELVGDLAVWFNDLENQRRYINYQISSMGDCPDSALFKYNNISLGIMVR